MINRRSLRYRINFTVALVLVAVTLVFGTVLGIYERQRRSAALQQIELSLGDLTNQYSEQLGNEIFAAQVLAIKATLDEVMKRDNLLAINVYDESGILLASTEKIDHDGDSAAALPPAPQAAIHEWHGQSALTFTSPVTAYGEKVGFWQINYSLATLEHQTHEIILIFSGLILSIAALFVLLLNSILVRFVLKPVGRLRDAMQHIQGTDTGQSNPEMASGFRSLDKMVQAFDELPADLISSRSAGNEISSLANSFRQMLLALKNAYIGIRTDPLTGLNNRMKLNEALDSEFKLASRYHTIFSVILLDIDKFKLVNDLHGHFAGDNVLRKMAELLKQGFRKTDTPGRWGGEEFLVVLPRQTGSEAIRTAERLRAIIEAAEFPGVGRVTASLGVAEYCQGETMENLLKRADTLLYKAKAGGRNRVEGDVVKAST